MHAPHLELIFSNLDSSYFIFMAVTFQNMAEGMLLTLILTLNQAAAAAQAVITMADSEASFSSSPAYIAAQYVDENINANAI